MVDLDNDPTKLIEIVEIGKQLLMTRGTLTTFSIANDVAKYFAIVPALFITSIPALQTLNIMHLHSPESAILSAVIFNAIIIPLLIPLALRGVAYKPIGASALLRRNLFIYGLGGIIVPFIGIKLIDMLVSVFFLIYCLNHEKSLDFNQDNAGDVRRAVRRLCIGTAPRGMGGIAQRRRGSRGDL